MPDDNQDFTWLYLPAQQEEMDGALAKVCAELADPDRESELHSRIRLVLEEIMMNIINHAYATDPAGPVHVGWRINSDASRTIKFVDSGEEFNPLQKEPPDTAAGLEDRPIGGLGIHLVREMCREIEYTRAGNENILTVNI